MLSRFGHWLPLTGGLLLAAAAPAALGQDFAAQENRRCLDCHGQAHLGEIGPADRLTMVGPTDETEHADTRPEIFVDPDVYRTSMHAQITCVACHPDCRDLPHPAQAAPAQCQSCHPREHEEFIDSVHGLAIAGGDEYAAHCWDCHGAHDILSSRNPQSRTYKLQLPFTCARCHANPRLMEEQHVHQPAAAEQYIDSMHGRGLLLDGLIVAPSCNDCHGVHDMHPVEDPRSRIHKDNVPHTCGVCHVGIEEVYNKSVHGQLLLAGDERGPVCSTCHTAHDIVQPGAAAFKLQSDERCGACHQDRLERYHETFHGKAIALGLPGVAACYDCHGHHDIQAAATGGGRLAEENRVETCKQCHPKAQANFANYIAHADHHDKAEYPILFWTYVIMTSIVVGTFVFFGIHTALWFVRSCALYFRDPKAFRHQKIKAVKDDEQFVRFRPFERFLHAMVVSSFLLLVATGMPLKFYYADWAQTLVRFMGGLEVAGVLHRAGAIITFLYFALHIGALLKEAIVNRAQFKNPKTGRYSLIRYLKVVFGPEMPLPTPNDVTDWWAHQKWFFGRGPQPQFDRWTYWEKFDYLAVFWGVFIIGASGMVLWFPEASTVWLPGWIINVAMIVHSDEALLAAGFIFTFHFFNVHFRPEKFPMDPVIFSGRMSRTEMLHERRRWYDRLVKEDKLEGIRVRDEWSQWKRVMHPLGFMAFGLGTLLLVLIFYAMGSRLFGVGP